MPDGNRVRYEMLKRLGYFVTESSEHFAEYTPWFIKRDRPELIRQFNIPLNEYLRRCEEQIAEWETMKRELEDENKPMEVCQSHEYAAAIINSLENDVPVLVNGNVPNTGLISNLPQNSVVEIPCHIDKNGIQPMYIGELPLQLSALIMTNINVHQLAVEAALTGKKEHVYHAAMLDPHTAAELSLEEICNMVVEMLDAHGNWIPQFN